MMDIPKIVQVDRAAATIHTHPVTVLAVLCEDGSVFRKSTQSYSREWSQVKLPDYHEKPIHVSISCANEFDNLIVNMTVLYADGAMAHTYPNMGLSDQKWSLEFDTLLYHAANP